jgi:hypothetical protein
MTKEQVATYIDSDKFRTYVNSADFVRRAKELYARLDAEPLTVKQSAKIVGLPVDVFRHLYAGHLAWEAVKQQLGTEH